MSMFAEVGDAERAGPDTFQLLRGMARRWITFLLVALAVFLVGVAATMRIPLQYVATARIQIDPSRNPLTPADSQVQGLETPAIDTQVSVLNSDDLARMVVQRLNLTSDPEFAPKGHARDPLGATVAALRNHLTVRRDKQTYIIDVSAQSREANKAAAIANAVARAYIDSQVGSQVGTAGRQAAFFQRQLNDLGAQVRAADDAVAQYRAREGIAEGANDATITDQQIGPLSTQLATAESDAAQARASVAAARSQIAAGGIDAVSAVRDSPVISDLRRQRAEVLRDMGQVDSRYGPKHSESIKVHEQLAAIDSQIKDEAERAINALQAQADSANARAASLRSAMGGLEGQQSHNARALAVASNLQHEADTKRAAYDRLSQLSLQSSQGVRNEIAQATIVDPATAPSVPTQPKRKLLFALSLAAALAAGSAVVFLLELLAPGIRDVRRLEARFGIPVIAAVPAVRRVRAPADLVMTKPASLYAEAFRMARASLFGARVSDPPQVVAITSALPEEGKTTTALALARMLAAGGTRTVLVDCDLRRATLNTLAASTASAGLVDVLRGHATIEQAIGDDPSSTLKLVTVTSPTPHAEDFMAGERLPELIAALRSRFDRVVLDLAPVSGLADARAAAAAADAVLLVVRWGRTPAAAVENAIRILLSDAAHLDGIVMTMVDPQSEAIGASYYSRKFSAYYQTA